MLIEGGCFLDERGGVQFVNDFDMTLIKRFYLISHSNTNVVRAWQGHKIENRWFYCVEGSFDIRLVKINNWDYPSDDLPVEKFILDSSKPKVLRIQNGYVNGIKALTKNSKLIVFSDYKLGDNINDEFRFDNNRWTNWND